MYNTQSVTFLPTLALQYKLAVSVHRFLRYRAPRNPPTAEWQNLKFPAADIYVRPAFANWIFHSWFGRSTFGTCGLSQSPVQRFGTHCLINCVIRPLSPNVFSGTWKHISLLSDIIDMSASEMSSFHGIALYKSTFTYLLTYSPTTVMAVCWLQPKVAQTAQQHVSYEFTLIPRTCDYI